MGLVMRLRSVLLLACLGSLAFGVSAASAAVTSSHITAPASGGYYQKNTDTPSDPAHQITVTGTSNGTTGDTVDIVCTYPGGSSPAEDDVADGVPVAAGGSFSYTGPPPKAEQLCVLRAITNGDTTLPGDLSPYTGPTIASGDFRRSVLSSGPNSGVTYDFYDNAAQFNGDADYQSVGDGGLYDAYPQDSGDLVEGADLFFAENYLENNNTDRPDIRIDSQPAYDSYQAEQISSTATGFPAVTFSSSQNPITGDLSVQESEPLVKCSPDDTVYPATSTSCTSFQPTGLTFNRTITQTSSGRQARLVDTYVSSGAQHALDVRYGQDFDKSDAGFRFPGESAYSTHTTGDVEPSPHTVPASIFVNYENTLADGDESGAQGAITLGDQPTSIYFVPQGDSGQTHLTFTYQRTVPAGGSTTLRTTYSWAFTKADAQGLALAAQQALTPPATGTYAATGVSATTATLRGVVNANAQATTYHFQYGTTRNYRSTTSPVAINGNSLTPVSAVISGLQPNTTYHYRLVASNASGPSTGQDVTFKTGAGLRFGHFKIKGTAATIPLRCLFTMGRCRGAITATIRVRVRHNHHTHTVTRTLGHSGYSIAAGHLGKITVKLNHTGRVYLARAHNHKLRVRFTIKLGNTVTKSQVLTFKAAARRR